MALSTCSVPTAWNSNPSHDPWLRGKFRWYFEPGNLRYIICLLYGMDHTYYIQFHETKTLHPTPLKHDRKTLALANRLIQSTSSGEARRHEVNLGKGIIHGLWDVGIGLDG